MEASIRITEALRQGIAAHRTGQLAQADRQYTAVLTVDRRNFDALHLLGLVRWQQGRNEEAARLIRDALAVDPNSAEACSNLGIVLEALGRPAEALAMYDRALTINPHYAKAFSHRGDALRALQRFEEALSSYDRALALDPNFVNALLNRGVTLRALDRPAEALECYEILLAMRPNFAEVHYNRGNALDALGRREEALASYDRALTIQPNNAEAWTNRGHALCHLMRHDDALASFEKALALKPDLADALFGRGLLLLRAGQFEAGWHGYEYRFQFGVSRKPIQAPQHIPHWSSESLAGRSILVYSEQGLGDAIQFVRYLDSVASLTEKVTFVVPTRLKRLLKPFSGRINMISDDALRRCDNLANFDFQCALLSLPYRLGTTLANIPCEVPYLFAEDDLASRWRRQIGEHGFKIGICWQGNPAHVLDRERSIPLQEFFPLSQIPEIRLISLQRYHGLEQIDRLPAGMRVEMLGPDFDSGADAFVDTAAILSHVDLVITLDSAVAHLAGAMARPTWVALPAFSDWRWLTDRSDSPWYPTIRLFRERHRDGWSAVFSQMAAELRNLVDRSQLTRVVS